MYGDKKGYLKPMNTLIERHIGPMRAFIEAVSSPVPVEASSNRKACAFVSGSVLSVHFSLKSYIMDKLVSKWGWAIYSSGK